MNAKVVLAVAALFVFSITAKAEHIGADGRPVGLTPAQKSKMKFDIQAANACGLRLDPNLPEIIDLQLKADLEAQIQAAIASDPGAVIPPATTDPGAGAPSVPSQTDKPDVKKTDEDKKDDDKKTSSRGFNTGNRTTGSSGAPRKDDLGSNDDVAKLKVSADAGLASCMKCHDGSAGPARSLAQIKGAINDPTKKATIIRMIGKAKAKGLTEAQANALTQYTNNTKLRL